MPNWPVHATIDGPIVMIGFGSIGRGVLPLIERHIAFHRDRFASSIRAIATGISSTSAAYGSSTRA